MSDAGSFIVQPKDDLVKKELRDAIRHKRLAKGLDELPEIEAKKPKTDEVINMFHKSFHTQCNMVSYLSLVA